MTVFLGDFSTPAGDFSPSAFRWERKELDSCYYCVFHLISANVND